MSKGDGFFSLDSSKSFKVNAETFLQKTNEHVLQGINPGGIYQAIWCRDAAYILKDWFISGNIDGVMQHIYQIWSHQIEPHKEKLVYGRGSPEMKFSAETTGTEMLARSRFNRGGECNTLLSKLASEGHPHIHALYEWINPITDEGSGSYPFRTGITTIRIAIADIEKINSQSYTSSDASSMR